jgi:hypothetical protein
MLNQIVTSLMARVADIIQSNPAGTLGKMVLVMAFAYLVVGCMRLAAASTETADRNKGRGNGWLVD